MFIGSEVQFLSYFPRNKNGRYKVLKTTMCFSSEKHGSAMRFSREEILTMQANQSVLMKTVEDQQSKINEYDVKVRRSNSCFEIRRK